jgi:tetratricopeptide (TPR) repeat protein
LALLEEAYEATYQSPIIAGLLADHREALGDPDHAIGILKSALEKKPNDTRLRDLLIQFEQEKGNFEAALKIAQRGIGYDPTSWRLQRHAARLMAVLNKPTNAIRGHYEAAVRHRKADVSLAVELGAFLFKHGLWPDAADVFSRTRDLPIPTTEKRQIREWWMGVDYQRRVFSGKVKQIRSATATAIAIPENFDAFFWRTNPTVAGLREGDAVRFHVGFNAFGPIARIL